ncbi:CwfJ C-terminus 2-domain-containing protein-like protein [Chytriomyces cf. hyalinus JEL632]|nr:CwfJ C-terminus 2-domain-containing protein-like protein [Chytriomyces cf. hyalinus JEL632]
MGKEKEKKHKKPKKEKKKKHSNDSDSDDKSESLRAKETTNAAVEDEWEEAPAPAIQPPPPQPVPTPAPSHAWMSVPESADPFADIGLTIKRTVSAKAAAKEEDQKRRDDIRKERELNKSFFDPNFSAPTSSAAAFAESRPPKKETQVVFGDSKSNWRMMRLKRLQEQASDESRDINELAMERWGSLEQLNQLLEEREFIDKRSGKRVEKFGRGTDAPGGSSRVEKYGSGFRKPVVADDSVDEFGRERRDDKKKDERSSAGHKHHSGSNLSAASSTSRIIPQAATGGVMSSQRAAFDPNEPVLTMDELNKLNARILKNSLMGKEDKELVEKFETERAKYEAHSANNSESKQDETVIVPTIDSRGQLQDIGSDGAAVRLPPGNSKRKREDLSATHDSDGQRVKYAGETEKEASINDLLLQEKIKSGANYDLEIANRITQDVTYREDLDYMDEKADDLAKKTQVSDYSKRQNAIHDYKKANASLEKCLHCPQELTGVPKSAVIASGARTYICLPTSIEMVPFHCQIVPLAHTLTTLELDDDDWTEIRNFMKCLIQMNWERDHGCIFTEQVVNFNWHKHTVIECVPVPLGKFEDAPAYFKEAMMASEEEWSQHKKMIDTSKNGFRRSMVKNLPYFHVWFEPNKGCGHVIEDSHEWPDWFGREVLASMMELSPDRWRKPRRAQLDDVERRRVEFRRSFDKFDWTKALG